ncbi:hypothetical protein LWC33_11590 [Pseudonocardia sp. RS11V-5]|uniref:hypothetical protein n=1 Tax=Pseudonocardia terrae TaxID=2905831 RepID=UPI001E39CF1C|nr:hypothetical protein [Pseudonocardia terrae]MCE3552100.1 hypothetical protein [Pseudonocardia terrae]
MRIRDTSPTQPTAATTDGADDRATIGATTGATNRAARRAAARGKAPQAGGAEAPRALGRIGRASTTPVHFRTDFAARRSG